LFVFNPDESKSASSTGNNEISKNTANKERFYVKRMDAGTYKVKVRKPGYKELEVSVSISDNERNKLVVKLERS
jgi:hypothetical protein